MKLDDAEEELVAIECEFGLHARILIDTLAIFGIDATIRSVEDEPFMKRIVFSVPSKTHCQKVSTIKVNLISALRSPGLRVEVLNSNQHTIVATIPHSYPAPPRTPTAEGGPQG